MNLIHLLVERGIYLLSAPLPVTALVIVKLLYWAPSTIKRTSLVEPTGLEPVTFSLQGNCAPNCATAPCQTAVLQSGRSDASMCYTFPFEVAAHRELLCRTLHSYSTAGCEFSLTRYPQRLSSLLYHRAILPRKPRWSSHGDSNSDFHLERVASQPVRGWDDKAGFYLSLLGSRTLSPTAAVAMTTGLEPVTSSVTGWHSNQLN